MIRDRRRQLQATLILHSVLTLAGLTGAWLTSSRATVSWAQSPALPPPPPQTLTVPAELPPVAPPDALPPVNVARPSPPVKNLKGYRVYVNGDSPLLLQQVRSVEPTAFVQTYQGKRVIQVGVFNDELNARQKIARLANQGIRSGLTNELVGSPLTTAPLIKGYYVVMPANQADLPQVRDQALRLGVPQNLMTLRDRPHGPHVAVGPFAKKQDAEAVESYLRKGGLEPRVYFDR
jgi:hypothetical protein